jgi:hypothetical protein
MGAASIGVLSVLPIAFGASSLVTKELFPPDPADWIAISIVSLCLGGALGLFAWKEFVGKPLAVRGP